MFDIVTVIVPCRNEEKYISACLNSILEFELPLNTKIEVLIIDGLSTDKTREILNEFILNHSCISLYDNVEIIQSAALNLGISRSNGKYILRIDAHAKYPKDYLINCFKTIQHTNADNVGGIVITLPGGNNFEATLVQAMTTHKFGVGNSAFRTDKKVGKVDTVPFGFFKKDIFNKIGFFDERLVRCQDYEFNRRIIKNGGKIWMNSEIYAEYYNQPTLNQFYKKQLYKEAPFNPYMWYLAPYSFAFRHVITGVFTSGIFIGSFLSIFLPIVRYLYLSILLIYFCLAFIASIQQSQRFKKLEFIFLLPGCFFMYHFIHGLGILSGIIQLILKKSPVQKFKKPWKTYDDFLRNSDFNISLPKI